MQQDFDVIVIGAGAAGLMCAIEAGKRGRRVIVLEGSNKPGKKILMSGGGRCNFTNYYIGPEKYLSHNPHFCKSALSRYTQWDFIELVDRYQIPYHEKTAGQLFCDNKAKDILNILLAECEKHHVDIRLKTTVTKITRTPDNRFNVKTERQSYTCQSLVIATGGLSIPSLGASPFGYELAKQFGLAVFETRAGLVPLTLHNHDKDHLSSLSGISVFCEVTNHEQSFLENILFTHRGLSGPAILQLSSYWKPGETINIDLLPNYDLKEEIQKAIKDNPKQRLKTFLSQQLAKRLVETFLQPNLAETPLSTLTHQDITDITQQFKQWKIKPNGTEGYRTAEVTLGGVDCNMLSSKTMEATQVPNLYFIGEVLDIAGWLGGYNFQWAWSSGWAAGQVV